MAETEGTPQIDDSGTGTLSVKPRSGPAHRLPIYVQKQLHRTNCRAGWLLSCNTALRLGTSFRPNRPCAF